MKPKKLHHDGLNERDERPGLGGCRGVGADDSGTAAHGHCMRSGDIIDPIYARGQKGISPSLKPMTAFGVNWGFRNVTPGHSASEAQSKRKIPQEIIRNLIYLNKGTRYKIYRQRGQTINALITVRRHAGRSKSEWSGDIGEILEIACSCIEIFEHDYS